MAVPAPPQLPLSLKDGRKVYVPDYTAFLASATWEDVYEPAEDSWLFLDAIFEDLGFLRERFGSAADRPVVCLEVGVGSGILSTHVHWTLKTQLKCPASCWATDINPKAVETARSVFKHNQVDGEVVVSDLVSGVLEQLRGKVDIMIFNPPYVPTGSEEVGSSGIEASWAGGIRGREVIDRLLPFIPELLSPRGACYMVLVRPNAPEEVAVLLAEYSRKLSDQAEGPALEWEVVLARRRLNEQLSINRFFWRCPPALGLGEVAELLEEGQEEQPQPAAAVRHDADPTAPRTPVQE